MVWITVTTRHLLRAVQKMLPRPLLRSACAAYSPGRIQRVWPRPCGRQWLEFAKLTMLLSTNKTVTARYPNFVPRAMQSCAGQHFRVEWLRSEKSRSLRFARRTLPRSSTFLYLDTKTAMLWTSFSTN